MCLDPMSMLAIGGAAAGAAGSLMSGAAGSEAAKANAQQAVLQAQVAMANSRMALDTGEGRAALVDKRVNDTIGAARAYYGAGNIAMNTGSPLAVTMNSAIQGNTDRQLTLAGALNAAAGQSFTASSAFSRANQDTQAASYARLAGIIGAGTSLMQGLGGIKGLGGAGAMGGMGGDWAPSGWGMFAGS